MVMPKFTFILGLALISTVLATTDDLMQPSRPTSLPPAKPGESEDPCAFSDLRDLLDRLEQNLELYNTALLVETCDNICQLIYGTGNPDLSGIGMMISYTIQGAVSLVFGPIFIFAVILVDGQKNPFSYFRSHENRSRWVNLSLQLAPPTHKLNSFTAVCVVISTSIRQNSRDPMFEAQFINSLSEYQFIMCILGSALYVFCCPVDSEVQYVVHTILFAVAAICSGIQFRQSIFSEKVVLPTKQGGNWRYLMSGLISKDCHILKGYPSAAWFESINRSGAGAWVLTFCTIFAFLITFLLVLDRLFSDSFPLRLVLRLLRRFFDRRFHVPLGFWRDRATRRLRPGLLATLCASFIFAAGTSFGTIDLLVSLKASRDRMREYVKDEYEDNDWGFGQILAVAVWAAWLLDALLTVIESFLPDYLVQPRRSQASHDIGSSSQRLHQQQLGQVRSKTSESQEQTTGVGGLVYHTSHIELDIADRRTLRSRPTWPRNERDTYLPG